MGLKISTSSKLVLRKGTVEDLIGTPGNQTTPSDAIILHTSIRDTAHCPVKPPPPFTAGHICEIKPFPSDKV